MADETLIPPRVIAVPSDRSWFDPRLLTVNTNLLVTDFAVQSAVPLQIAKANPARIGIIITADISATQASFAPWPDVLNIWLVQLGFSQFSASFTLFDWGLIVCNPWYVNSGNPGNIRVTEWIRN